MSLKVYVDRMSQPSRAVLIFCKVNGIEFEEIKVDLAKKEHRLPEFKAINPFGQVPSIADGDFKLFESHAILSYLACASQGIADHWYPSDLQKRAKINSVLDWHHSNLRRGGVGIVINTILGPVLGIPTSPEAAAEAEKVLTSSLSKIESVWLNENGNFLLGSKEPSIADLSLVCEIMQFEVNNRTIGIVINTILGPALGMPTSPEAAAEAEKVLTSSLSKIESVWLNENGDFLLGNKEPSIADIILVCEIMQFELLHEKDRVRVLTPFKKVLKWVEDTRIATSPHFEEVHKTLFALKSFFHKLPVEGNHESASSIKAMFDMDIATEV